jgi:tryptophan synthase beta subunit
MGQNAASITYGSEGVMHGFDSMMLKDKDGGPAPVYSVASGLDYPSVGPEHAFLHEIGGSSMIPSPIRKPSMPSSSFRV